MTPVTLATTNQHYVPRSPQVEIVPTTAAHIRELQKSLRENDRREIEGYGFSSAQGLWKSYRFGLMNKTGLIEGKVGACWGVGGSFLGDLGAPWLMTSYEVEKISPLRFAKIYQNEVFNMLSVFPKLVNFVLADYEKAVRLLSIVGFTLGDPEPIGNSIYRKFEMKAA